MNAKYLIGIVLVVAVDVMGLAIYQSSLPASSTPFTNGTSAGSETINPGSLNGGETSATTTSTTDSTASTGAKSYTMAQVALHNDASSCWSVINGNVYDLTSWISQHPGGPEHILGICGADGSAAFNHQHGGQSQPTQILQSFYIGTLTS